MISTATYTSAQLVDGDYSFTLALAEECAPENVLARCTDVPAEAMQAYLDWEYGLVAQLERDCTHGFAVLTQQPGTR